MEKIYYTDGGWKFINPAEVKDIKEFNELYNTYQDKVCKVYVESKNMILFSHCRSILSLETILRQHYNLNDWVGLPVVKKEE